MAIDAILTVWKIQLTLYLTCALEDGYDRVIRMKACVFIIDIRQRVLQVGNLEICTQANEQHFL